MSKSVGNVATIRETLDEWGSEAILVFFLTAHWRKPIDFSPETMAQAAARRDTLRNAFTLAPAEHDESGWAVFAAALDDDFDTPAALAVLHDWASSGQLELLRRGLAVFGLESLARRDDAPADVAELAERRAQARAERDFETSDRLRDELAASGWEMRDEPDGGYTLVRRST
jgi:cysteinyl-tRNA synthetase